MNIIEAAKALEAGKVVRKPYSLSTWVHLYPDEPIIRLSIADLFATDYEVVE